MIVHDGPRRPCNIFTSMKPSPVTLLRHPTQPIAHTLTWLSSPQVDSCGHATRTYYPLLQLATHLTTCYGCGCCQTEKNDATRVRIKEAGRLSAAVITD